MILDSIINGLTNLFSTDKVNQAQIQIARETNEMNQRIAKERNLMEIEESQKAYDRSTPANLIKELIKSGASVQQARQIVFGSGSPASYPAAQLEAAQMQQPAALQVPDLSGFGSAIGSVGDLLQNAITDPSGGTLGFLSAQGAMKDLSDIIGVLPEESLISWKDFSAFVNSSDNDIIKKFSQSDSFKKVQHNLLGQKAFMNYARESYDSSGADAMRRSAIIDAQIKEVTLGIDKFRKKIEESNMNIILTENNLRMQNLPDLYARDLLLIQDELATLRPKYKYHSDEDYQKQALEIFKMRNLNEKWFEHFKLLKNDAARRGYENMSLEEQLLLDFISNLNVLGIDNEKVLALMLATQVSSGISHEVAHGITEAPSQVSTFIDKLERASQVHDQNVRDKRGTRKRGATRSF